MQKEGELRKYKNLWSGWGKRYFKLERMYLHYFESKDVSAITKAFEFNFPCSKLNFLCLLILYVHKLLHDLFICQNTSKKSNAANIKLAQKKLWEQLPKICNSYKVKSYMDFIHTWDNHIVYITNKIIDNISENVHTICM